MSHTGVNGVGWRRAARRNGASSGGTSLTLSLALARIKGEPAHAQRLRMLLSRT